MMVETATVVAYREGIATVQCQAKSGCGGCSAQSGCGTKSLSALVGERFAPRFELEVPEVLEVGDKVQLGLPEQTLLRGIMWIYCLPLLALVASSLLLSQFIEQELWVALGIVACTGLSFFVARQKLRAEKARQFEPIYLGKCKF
ncbi:transcriptional regulator [Pasteurellaceae bacterium RH1A]|nr:transcriptional regulator [Pasteurellaceae bacterium RH1A]